MNPRTDQERLNPRRRDREVAPARPTASSAAPSGRGAAVAGISASLVTVALTAAVAQGATDGVDRDVLGSLRATPGSWVAELAAGFTSVGDAAVLVTVLLFAGALLPTDRAARWCPVVLPLLATGLARLVCETLKRGLARPRPPAGEWLGPASGFAFPSGHATSATAGFVTLLLLVGGSGRASLRRVWRSALVLLPLLIGWSRVQLGVHWPTDVVAGWALGLTVACGLSCLDHGVTRLPVPNLNAIAPAVPRRAPVSHSGGMTADHGDLFLDPANYAVGTPNGSLRLNAPQFRILSLLLAEPGVAVTRRQLLESIAEHDEPVSDRSLDTHLAALRQALTRCGSHQVLESPTPDRVRLR
jgi:undecaprenyl-diphosphatase